jgi:broad specificity phosphatase PhoE
MATRMIYVRHGNTGYPSEVFVGSSDIDLVEGSLEKARELGERLRKEGIRAIYTSQLMRAWKTAEAIGEVLGINPVRLKELNEVDFGKWELKTKGDVEKEHPGLLDNRRKDIWNFNENVGESYGHARDRVKPVLEGLFKKYEGETFVVVLHGALLHIVYSLLMKVPFEKTYNLKHPFLCTFYFKKEGDKIELEKS